MIRGSFHRQSRTPTLHPLKFTKSGLFVCFQKKIKQEARKPRNLVKIRSDLGEITQHRSSKVLGGWGLEGSEFGVNFLVFRSQLNQN